MTDDDSMMSMMEKIDTRYRQWKPQWRRNSKVLRLLFVAFIASFSLRVTNCKGQLSNQTDNEIIFRNIDTDRLQIKQNNQNLEKNFLTTRKLRYLQDNRPALTAGKIVGIVLGGFLLGLIGYGLFHCFFFKRKETRGEVDQIANDADSVHASTASPKGAGTVSGEMSFATVDYDYSKTFTTDQHSVVSSAAGTFGDATRITAGDLTLGAGMSVAGGTAVMSYAVRGPTTGNVQYDDETDAKHTMADGASFKEELIVISAPPGKLGVFLKKDDEGPPVVHAVKDTSVIADQIQVGDRLLAVDDEDVRTMIPIRVSKLISEKTNMPCRKMTVIRTTLVEEAIGS